MRDFIDGSEASGQHPTLFKSLAKLLTLIVMFAASLVGQAPRQSNASAGRLTAPLTSEKGAQLYEKYGCYECHGRAGQGSKLSGPKLGPEPILFAAFTAYVRYPNGQMPPYTAKVLSDAQLASIYAFVKALPAPSSVNSVSALLK